MDFMTRSFASMALGLCLILAGCNTAKVTNQSNLGTIPASRPTVVYVSDFDLDAGEIQSSGVATLLPFRPLTTGLLPRPFGILPQSKETTARNLVDSMATSLVKDLKEQGFTAQRIAATGP